VKARIKNFLSNAFNYFYIAIWFCMKLGCARSFSHVYFKIFFGMVYFDMGT